MSKEVKFRAWDKQKKQMVYGIEETYDGLPYSELNEKVELDIYNHMSCFSSWICGDYEVMQYTGLKDKDGVEIYEGDIISYTMLRFNGVGYETEEEYGVVEYGDAVFEIDGVPLYVAHAEDDEIEIIGNIYENPELLEEITK